MGYSDQLYLQQKGITQRVAITQAGNLWENLKEQGWKHKDGLGKIMTWSLKKYKFAIALLYNKQLTNFKGETKTLEDFLKREGFTR